MILDGLKVSAAEAVEADSKVATVTRVMSKALFGARNMFIEIIISSLIWAAKIV